MKTVTQVCPDYGGDTNRCVWNHNATCGHSACLKGVRPSSDMCPTCGSAYWWTSTPTGSKRHCGCCQAPQSGHRCHNYVTCSRIKTGGCYRDYGVNPCWSGENQ
jgi:hypothetical protein